VSGYSGGRSNLDALPAGELAKLEAKATSLGDYILAGHLLRDVHGRWTG